MPPSDFAGDKFVFFGTVENETGQVLGLLNGLFGQIINSPGTRAYGITPDPNLGTPTLLTFDLTATPTGNPPLFPQLGTPMALPTTCSPGSCLGGFYALTTTPDGSVLFIAGPNGVIVQPIS